MALDLKREEKLRNTMEGVTAALGYMLSLVDMQVRET